jgi:BirA family transcriptional regulator, biotin operon repressor / biotin---[acetyl-CoA-carboxylase] ligase
MPDAYLDADEIRAATFIRHVEIHDTLGSTNDRAAELARDIDIELPALIAARQQTAGRGRGSNTWWSANGALTFSIVLDPATFGISAANWPQLSLTTAVAVCNAVAFELNPKSERSLSAAAENPKSAGLAIKWPNDIMLNDRKLCGILIESPGGLAPAKDRLVVGIGININNSLRAAPRELASHATSLCDQSAKQHSLQNVLVHVLNEFQRQLVRLGQHDPQLPLAWQHLCWLLQKKLSAQVGRQIFAGICMGIADDGALLIETGSTITSIYGGSLRLGS